MSPVSRDDSIQSKRQETRACVHLLGVRTRVRPSISFTRPVCTQRPDGPHSGRNTAAIPDGRNTRPHLHGLTTCVIKTGHNITRSDGTS
ncbi:hypothetical protein DPEC_G00254820 [Dallia pectoralis]|uniref:Uncharacterized protein n=1 Tax=Dallia pectoralis TaxID=75939 RepID=A0ACC2FUF5_DALPE|nr:hypothetical protein DPEC_G00254820 [Dallia pectoralis]